jgi:hypothetical protein
MDGLKTDATKLAARADALGNRRTDAETGSGMRDRIRGEHKEANTPPRAGLNKNPASFEHHAMEHLKPVHEKLAEKHFGQAVSHLVEHGKRVASNGTTYSSKFGPNKIISRIGSRGSDNKYHVDHYASGRNGETHVGTSKMPPHPNFDPNWKP